jgi:pimeloyl-ACP methyl ester carboxylesterase
MITYDHIASFDADPREGIRSRLAGKSFVYAGFKLIGALAVVKNVGHCPQLSAPSASAAAIDAFLERAGL